MQATTTAGRIVWHELATADIDGAVGFYRDLLGIGIQIWHPGGADYRMIEVAGTAHGGFQQAPEGLASHWFGHIQVEDVDAAAERAAHHGASILAGPIEMPEVGRFALVSDPYGAVFSLYRPTLEGLFAEGLFVWDEILTPDVSTTAGFYADVVGWRTRESELAGGEPYILFARADGSDVAGCVRKPDDVPGPAAWVTYIGVEDVDGTAARAQALGGSIWREPFDIADVGRIAVVADSAGARFGLFRPAG